MDVMLITLSIQDADAQRASVSVYAEQSTGDTVESLFTDYVTVFWDVLRPLINGVLVGVNVTLNYDVAALTNNSFNVLSDIQERAKFLIRVCGAQRPTVLTIPTVKESIFENGGAGKLVDAVNSDVVAFSYVMTNDVVDGGISATDSHGADLCQVTGGYQLFRE